MSTHAKNVRRAQAEARQAARDARTPEEQIALLRTRPGASDKEMTRLYKQTGSIA